MGDSEKQTTTANSLAVYLDNEEFKANSLWPRLDHIIFRFLYNFQNKPFTKNGLESKSQLEN